MSGLPVRVLLAEDEEHLGTILETFLRSRGQLVTRVRDGRAALDALHAGTFDVALLDVIMPELDGLEVLRALGAMPAPPEAIVMTGNGTVDTAITAIQLGAYDYLAKPYRMAEVDLLIWRAAEKRALRLAAAARRWAGAPGDAVFITRMPELGATLAAAEREARANGAGPWIVSGPPGSGRRTLARWLHARSPRADQPVLLVSASGDAAVDAASLFGTVDRAGDAAIGALEAAGRGMVVVDGWSRLHPSLRESLGSAAATGETRRGGDSGGAASVPVGALLCVCVDDPATLPTSLAGAASIVVQLPPLIARPADVPAIAEHFLARHFGAGDCTGAGGRGAVSLHQDAAAALTLHEWPGQVAELRDVISVAAWRVTGSAMRAAHLPLPAQAIGAASRAEGIAAPARAEASLAELERDQIAAVLEEVGWHRGRAAARLGISVRTLYRRIRQLGFAPGAGAAGRHERGSETGVRER